MPRMFHPTTLPPRTSLRFLRFLTFPFTNIFCPSHFFSEEGTDFITAARHAVKGRLAAAARSQFVRRAVKTGTLAWGTRSPPLRRRNLRRKALCLPQPRLPRQPIRNTRLRRIVAPGSRPCTSRRREPNRRRGNLPTMGPPRRRGEASMI